MKIIMRINITHWNDEKRGAIGNIILLIALIFFISEQLARHTSNTNKNISMREIKKGCVFGYSSFAQAILIAVTGYCGLFVKGTYTLETTAWYVQSIGQDIVDLFIIVPVLIITGMMLYKRKIFAIIFAGTELYIIYTFLIYCFSLRFNYLFLIYCSVLGLSFYSFIYFIFCGSAILYPPSCTILYPLL